jgi:epoxyqueuosine reductase
MDWWDSQEGGTPGNRVLINITRGLIKWLRKAYSVEAFKLPYHADKRGIFLKDAAVLAGLGVIGKNNLLITPRHGPRVRLRALLLKRSLQSTGPLDGFAPCVGCDGPCLQACPRKSFRGGFYQRQRCLLQMKKNETDKIVLQQPVVGMPADIRIAYCRMCEMSCPIGK